jgi:hypothetical protein
VRGLEFVVRLVANALAEQRQSADNVYFVFFQVLSKNGIDAAATLRETKVPEPVHIAVMQIKMGSCVAVGTAPIQPPTSTCTISCGRPSNKLPALVKFGCAKPSEWSTAQGGSEPAPLFMLGSLRATKRSLAGSRNIGGSCRSDGELQSQYGRAKQSSHAVRRQMRSNQ